MRLTPQSDRRRSQRVLLSIAVRISGTNVSGAGFAEDTSTVIVNAHGGLVLVKTAVHLGQQLKIRNLNTGEETSCVAVDANVETGEAREVGMEFAAAAPRFWRISFPPADWNSHSPEAKRFRQTSPAHEAMPLLTVKK
jgi:hypothetical protein